MSAEIVSSRLRSAIQGLPYLLWIISPCSVILKRP